MIKIGREAAPDFSCNAVIGGNIKRVTLQDFEGSYKLIFFYPLNFTFVCPTELHALQEYYEEFKKRGVEVLAVSTDSVYSHLAWLDQPKSKGGICGITYPLLGDTSRQMVYDYGVMTEEGFALRGTFLLDKNNVVQYAAINNLPLGRNIAELVRLVDALQHVEKNGEVCPANWNQGQEAMKATQGSLETYFLIKSLGGQR
ncbi:peroxiredoxin [Candidatus Babeliales bacterium]|nr:peroxiredoxin [Candidatus Babeliales bacterium]